MDYSIVFVCLMGMGTVFFGLICLIVLTTLLSAVSLTFWLYLLRAFGWI